MLLPQIAAWSITGCQIGDCFGSSRARGLKGSYIPVLEAMLESKLSWHFDVVSMVASWPDPICQSSNFLITCMYVSCTTPNRQNPELGEFANSSKSTESVLFGWKTSVDEGYRLIVGSQCDTSYTSKGLCLHPRQGTLHACLSAAGS